MKLIYGTLKECTDKLFKMIDFENMIFPDFDFASCVDEDAESPEDAYESAESWFGVKDLGKSFDTDTISLMFAHYGGGGIESMELCYLKDYYDEEEPKKLFMQKIESSTSVAGIGELTPDDYTVFEILERGEGK